MVEKIKNNLSLLAVIFGFFAVLTIFFPALSVDVEEAAGVSGAFASDGFVVGVSGWGSCFGWEVAEEEAFEFSFMASLAYAAPAIAVVLLFVAENKQDKKYVQYAFVAFAVGALLLFLMPSLVQYADKAIKEEIEDVFELGIGAIFGAISCIVSALCILADLQNKEQRQQVSQEMQQI
ncbi:MAG: hypothetical protein IKA72_02485 [Clostridia bacterium]|nr:hypothetical protein [Clostridia bacterium]